MREERRKNAEKRERERERDRETERDKERLWERETSLKFMSLNALKRLLIYEKSRTLF